MNFHLFFCGQSGDIEVYEDTNSDDVTNGVFSFVRFRGIFDYHGVNWVY